MENKRKDTFSFLRLLCAFVLAVLLWYFINGSSNNIITRYVTDVPVSLVNEDVLAQKNLAVDNDFEYFVNLEVRGTEESLESINPSELVAEVDLSKVESAGSQNLNVVVRGLNNRVILDETVPGTVQVKVDEITDDKMRPEILAQGKPAAGYSVISVTTNQDVSLNGLSAELDKVETVSGTVSVNGMQEPSEAFVKVYPYDSDGNIVGGVSCTPEIVQAEINIGATKNVPINTPKIDGTVKDGYKVTDITLKPKEVTIAGQPDVISGVESVDLESVTIPEGEGNTSFTTESSMVLPKGVSALEGDTSVQVSVNIEQIIERAYTVSNLTTSGLGAGLEVSRINPGSVVVRISGTASELQKIDGSKLNGKINLAGKGEGNHTLNVEVSVSGGKLVSITPESVEVEIKKK